VLEHVALNATKKAYTIFVAKYEVKRQFWEALGTWKGNIKVDYKKE
jgi:hypothetical protein